MTSSAAEKFIMSSDFATLKNDGTGTVSVTLGGSITVPGGQVASVRAVLNVGTKGSLIRSRIASSKDATRFYACTSLTYLRFGTILGMPGFHNVYGYVARTSPTQIECIVAVNNPYSDPLVTASGSETFTFEISTFIPPFA